MTKLYHDAESWIVPGQQGKGATRADVPISPPELAAWLNDRRVPIEPGAGADVAPCNTAADELLEQDLDPQLARPPSGPRVAGHCDSCGRSAAGTLKLGLGNDLETIGAWLETAELWTMSRVVELVRDRVELLGKTIDERGTIQ